MNKNTQKDESLAIALRALGHPVRLEILRVMASVCKNQCCCTDVAKCFDLAQSTVSQHIKVLLEAGLITREAKGVRNCYLICFEKLNDMQNNYNDYIASLNKDEEIDEKF